MRTATRCAVIVLAALFSTFGSQPSEAQSKGPKPWCIANGAFGPGTLDCTYWTLQQCRESASGAGGTCDENPTILWARRGYVQQHQQQPRRDRSRW